MEISLGFVISGGSEVVLYDVNRHALRIMGKIVSNYILSENVDLEVSYTTDLKDALENSDFVITTIRVGGYKKYYRDSDEIWCTWYKYWKNL